MLFNAPAKDSDEFFKAAAISLLNNFSSLASPINRSSRCDADNFLCRCLRLSSINLGTTESLDDALFEDSVA